MIATFSSLLLGSAALAVAGPVLVPRVVDSLNEAATEEAQQRDGTATRAFSNVQIKTSDGRCLFVDKLSGDFRANLTPIQVGTCGANDGEGWDVITAGKHINVANAMTIVSTTTQACFNFDPRRAAGNQVLLFSCGGRADGGGDVTNSQLFDFDGGAGPLAFAPQNDEGRCLAVMGNVLDVAGCNAGDDNQAFTFGGAGAAPADNAQKGGDNKATKTRAAGTKAAETKAAESKAAETKAAEEAPASSDCGPKRIRTVTVTASIEGREAAPSPPSRGNKPESKEPKQGGIALGAVVPDASETASVETPAETTAAPEKEDTDSSEAEATTAAEAGPTESASEEPAASTAAAEKAKTKTKSKNRGKGNSRTKTRSGQAAATTAASETAAIGIETSETAATETAATESIALETAAETASETAASDTSSAAAPVLTGKVEAIALPTTPVPVSRAGGTLQPSAAAEANQRDETATRAFSNVEIRAPNGQCLFVDPTAGDFRMNLIPVSLVDCSGTPNEKWDVITAGNHNNAQDSALIVSSLMNGCISFDGRRPAGDTVTMFSCGGRADGEGETNSGQLTRFIGALSFAIAPSNEKGEMCVLDGPDGRLTSGPCPTDGAQLFSIFP